MERLKNETIIECIVMIFATLVGLCFSFFYKENYTFKTVIIMLTHTISLSCLLLILVKSSENNKWVIISAITFIFLILGDVYLLYDMTHSQKTGGTEITAQYVADEGSFDVNITLTNGKNINLKAYSGRSVNKIVRLIEKSDFETMVITDHDQTITVLVIDQIVSIKVNESPKEICSMLIFKDESSTFNDYIEKKCVTELYDVI